MGVGHAVKVTVRDGGGGMQAAPRYDPQGYGVRLQCYGEGPRGSSQSCGIHSPELSEAQCRGGHPREPAGARAMGQGSEGRGPQKPGQEADLGDTMSSSKR